MGEFISAEGLPIRHRHWDAPEPEAALIVLPGMAEHTLRYARFAQALARQGISVMAVETRGHGEGARRLGWYAQNDGWKLVCQDARAGIAHMQKLLPGVPLVLLGHSTGSIFARVLLMDEQALAVKACILLGVTVDRPVRRRLAPAIAWLAGHAAGIDRPNRFLSSLLFDAFNRKFAPNRTAFDWLSRDEAEVDAYVADPLCGFDCTGSMYVDAAKALLYTLRPGSEARIRVPVLIAVGGEDPVGGPAAARFLEKRWKARGKDVRVAVYSGARHEILHELNRDEATLDFAAFVLRVARAPGQ